MHVLIAPDHFGGALSAKEAAEALGRGWLHAGHHVTLVPMSDGERGLSEAIHGARGGTLLAVPTLGALGQHAPATVLQLPETGTAYIESAQVLGPAGADQGDAARRAEVGSSAGVADLLVAAMAAGARRVVIGAGVSATHDAGAGLWLRLAELLDVDVRAAVPWLALADLRRELQAVDVVVAGAQGLPLTGLHGAGAALRRFPGISAAAAQEIEHRTSVFTTQAQRHAQQLPPVRPVLNTAAPVIAARSEYAGVGGGIGFALGLLGARVLPGARVVAQEVGISEAISAVDLVITGGAALNADAMHDGVIATIGRAAADLGLPAVAIAHEVHPNRRELAGVGISAAYPVVDQPLVPDPLRQAPAGADLRRALTERGDRLVRNWAR